MEPKTAGSPVKLSNASLAYVESRKSYDSERLSRAVVLDGLTS